MTEKEELEKLRAEKEQKGIMRLKVSEKGGLSLYGLGRFPVTLYKSQWEKLLDYVPQIKSFIEENKNLLKEKLWVSIL